MTHTMRTVLLIVVTAVWTLGLLWGATQFSGTTIQDDIVRVCQERGC